MSTLTVVCFGFANARDSKQVSWLGWLGKFEWRMVTFDGYF
jgi:hypothetical protein